MVSKQACAGENADAGLIVGRPETASIMRELKAKLTELKDEVSSKSALGKAVSYTFNH
jgi:transposase